MITRLAVGLATANNMIDTAVFSSFVLLATVTTVVTPPLARKFLHYGSMLFFDLFQLDHPLFDIIYLGLNLY